jgi:hypothetical protein
LVTRLYFHNATDSTTGLPTAEQASLTSNLNMEGSQTTNRQMNITIGTSQASVSGIHGSTSLKTIYFTRFVSAALSVSSISANTWTYNFSTKEVSASENFPVSGSGFVYAVCYVWRPSSSTKVGTIIDGFTAANITEPAANTQVVHHTTFSGSSVASLVAGDVIIFEVWFDVDPAAGAGTTTISFFYDGTTANTTNNATVSNHASFLETPQDNLFAPSTITMTESAAKTYSNKFITKV